MTEISIRDLRNHGGEVVDRLERGESATITRDGRAVAELRPLARAPLTAAVLLARWRHLPPVDEQSFRADVDALVDPGL